MKLPADTIATRLKELPGWTLEGGALQRQFTFASFPDAIAFVTRLGFDAEAADHHPDIQISYKRVTVRWSTHSAGGITEKDFSGVRQSDTIAARLPMAKT
jgi:4a-hydroxytetrahydrobiopterin dehydratase